FHRMRAVSHVAPGNGRSGGGGATPTVDGPAVEKKASCTFSTHSTDGAAGRCGSRAPRPCRCASPSRPRRAGPPSRCAATTAVSRGQGRTSTWPPPTASTASTCGQRWPTRTGTSSSPTARSEERREGKEKRTKMTTDTYKKQKL